RSRVLRRDVDVPSSGQPHPQPSVSNRPGTTPPRPVQWIPHVSRSRGRGRGAGEGGGSRRPPGDRGQGIQPRVEDPGGAAVLSPVPVVGEGAENTTRPGLPAHARWVD